MLKIRFYSSFWIRYILKLFNRDLPDLLFVNKYSKDIDYYCKISDNFSLNNSINIEDLNLFKNSGYTYDFYRIIFPFKKSFRFRFLAGDITSVPKHPTFLKSRPISEHNCNSILLPLDSTRHFKFVRDNRRFLDKKNAIVWRGAAYQPNRIDFLRKFFDKSFINAGNTAVSKNDNVLYKKPRMSIIKQLEYKFILSLEGNDVATNLKWIMSSNSVCIMPKPKFETWYQEGNLLPDFHYIEIEDDFSDLEEKFNHFMKYPDKCTKIISNARKYSLKFQSHRLRLKLARAVCLKYSKYSQI